MSSATTFRNSPQCLAKISAPTHEWNFEIVLIYMVLLIGHCKDFTFIDVVDFNRFQYLSFYKMPNSSLFFFFEKRTIEIYI